MIFIQVLLWPFLLYPVNMDRYTFRLLTQIYKLSHNTLVQLELFAYFTNSKSFGPLILWTLNGLSLFLLVRQDRGVWKASATKQEHKHLSNMVVLLFLIVLSKCLSLFWDWPEIWEIEIVRDNWSFRQNLERFFCCSTNILVDWVTLT